MIEFRAGKMYAEGSRVIPDNRKGLVRVARGEEGLMHFQWLDRTQELIEDDQIIFPEEAVFEKVTQASGRVYILKFNSDNRKFFFWMQEPNPERDADLCSSVNDYINQPLEFQDEDEAETEADADASAALQVSEALAEDNIARSRTAVGGTLGTAGPSAPGVSSGPVKLEDLQRILSSIEPADVPGGSDGGLGLGDILKPDLIMPFIESIPLEQTLGSYLPEGPWTSEDILELLQSPPFRQQVDSFTYVLRTGQVDLSQFGIDPEKYKFTVTSFLEALEDSVSKSKNDDESVHDDKDITSQPCNHSDPMDEEQ